MYIPYNKIKNLNADTIKLLNITQAHKKHQHCDLLIKNSKNDVHRGLYCCNHKKWLQWITFEQEQTLKKMGVQVQAKPYVDMDWQ